MKRKWTYLVAALAVSALAIASGGCQKLRARDQLNRGVQAFKNAKYSEAVERFKTAVELDPTFSSARLYLAVAYFQQYIPGADSPENQQMLKAAKDEFNRVLQSQPNDTTALAYLAQLNYSEAGSIQDMDKKVAKLDESRQWYEKLSQVDPKNKEALYSLGVIAWAKWYPAIGAARAKLGMKPEDPPPLKEKKVREELRAKYWTVIDSGITNLRKALDVDRNYDEAMAYLNLLYRERADIAESPQECKNDIQTADNWLQKALDTRKAKAGVSLSPTGAAAAPAAAEQGK